MSQNQIWISSGFSRNFSSSFLANGIGTLEQNLQTEKCMLKNLAPLAFPVMPCFAPHVSATLLQKWKVVRFWFPATIPVPYEPPGSGLSGNINLKKSTQGPILLYNLHWETGTFSWILLPCKHCFKNLLVRAPRQNFLNFIFPESPLPRGSYGTGTVAGNQNLTSFRFCSSVVQ